MDKTTKNYQNIFKSFQYFRLKKAAEKQKHILDSNKIDTEVSKYNVVGKLANFYKGKKSEKTQENLTDIELTIKDFEEKNKEFNYKLYYESGLEKNINELFKEDKYGLSKLLFSINVIFDQDFEYVENDETFKVMSSVLFYDSTRFGEIEKQFKQLFLSINRKELSKLQKGILIGLGASSVAAVIFLPILAVGGINASAAVTTGALAAIGLGDMQLGVGFATMYSLITGIALCGLGYGSMRLINRDKLKQEFYKLTMEESAMLLTIKAMLIAEAKKKMPKDKFKEEVSAILEIIDDLKSDTEYLLFAENNDINLNKERIGQFHRWDNELIRLLNL